MIGITINGKLYEVIDGTTVAAAILNKGISRRSVTNSERNPVCGMGSCFECVAVVDGSKETRTCLLKVREGMNIRYE